MAVLEKLTEDVVKIPLTSETKTEILDELLEILVAKGVVKNREKVFQKILEREAQVSTGLDNGIAIPHAKSEGVDSLVCSVGVKPEGIDFESHDGQLTKLFFLVIAPLGQTGPHIEALKEIAVLVSDNTRREKLFQAKTSKELLDIIHSV